MYTQLRTYMCVCMWIYKSVWAWISCSDSWRRCFPRCWSRWESGFFAGTFFCAHFVTAVPFYCDAGMNNASFWLTTAGISRSSNYNQRKWKKNRRDVRYMFSQHRIPVGAKERAFILVRTFFIRACGCGLVVHTIWWILHFSSEKNLGKRVRKTCA